tara:strand:- start:298 stop:918 length:621 start_codon:yes stop_codon:yes gene_type:complete
MNKQTTTTAIKFTPAMRTKGLTAFTSGGKADSDKAAFFKAIHPRVSLEQVPKAFAEFKGIAMHYYAESHGLGDALIIELAKPTIKNDAKMKGCKLTMSVLKKGIDTMARRWSNSYKAFLKTGDTDQRKGKAKRATKGKVVVKPQTDTSSINTAEKVVTPIKAAIEYVTAIPRAVLYGPKPSQCDEGLRQKIEVAALELATLLMQIK